MNTDELSKKLFGIKLDLELIRINVALADITSKLKKIELDLVD